MPYKRTIPIILLDDDDCVKTELFTNSIYIGDPLNVAKVFNDKDPDEICLLNISGDVLDLELLKDIASEVYVPLSYGGGLRNLYDIKNIFECGVEKVYLNYLFFKDKNTIIDSVSIYGSQAIGISLDVKMLNNTLLVLNRYTGHFEELQQHIKSIELLNVGEVLIQDVELEGSRKGLNKKLVSMINELFSCQVVYSGGISSTSEIDDYLLNYNSIGVGSLFCLSKDKKSPLISYYNQEIYY